MPTLLAWTARLITLSALTTISGLVFTLAAEAVFKSTKGRWFTDKVYV